jgi:hypothetical protein
VEKRACDCDDDVEHRMWRTSDLDSGRKPFFETRVPRSDVQTSGQGGYITSSFSEPAPSFNVEGRFTIFRFVLGHPLNSKSPNPFCSLTHSSPWSLGVTWTRVAGARASLHRVTMSHAAM